MFIVNEQIARSIDRTPNIIKSALKDTEFFLKSSNHELQVEIFENFDRTREKIKLDLEGEVVSKLTALIINNTFITDIDKLLGERITREVSIQTDLDMTFESTTILLESKLLNKYHS